MTFKVNIEVWNSDLDTAMEVINKLHQKYADIEVSIRIKTTKKPDGPF